MGSGASRIPSCLVRLVEYSYMPVYSYYSSLLESTPPPVETDPDTIAERIEH